jgi:hypothetical protein
MFYESDLDQMFGRSGRGTEPPLMVGSVYGHRTFLLTLYTKGLHSPIAATTPWTAEVKEADCLAHAMTWGFYGRGEREPHSISRCTCGFYAYYRRQRNKFTKSVLNGIVVVGIIEGSGETLIGTKGFRSKRARLVAVAPRRFGVFQPDTVRLLREAVPGVPVYRSKRAMYKAFPLSRAKEFVVK